MKKFIILTWMLCCIPLAAWSLDMTQAQPDYLMLRDVQGNPFLMDTGSIEVTGDLVRYAWMPHQKQARQIARGMGCPVAKQVKRAVVVNASNCSKNTIFTGVQVIFYNAKDEPIWIQNSDQALAEGKSPKKKSVFTLFHETACNLAYLPPATAEPTMMMSLDELLDFDRVLQGSKYFMY